MSQTYLPWLISAVLQCLNRLTKMACRVSVTGGAQLIGCTLRCARALCSDIWYLNHPRPQTVLHVCTLHRRTLASRRLLAGNDAYLFSPLVYRKRPRYQD